MTITNHESRGSTPGRRTFFIDAVGPVLFEKRPRARSVRISVRASTGVVVAVPMRVSFETARREAAGRAEWMRRTLLVIRRVQEERREAVAAARALDRRAARAALAARTAELAERHGFSFRRVSVRVQATLWGSASRSGTIQLNARLAVIPPDLRDYVILHELVHTRVAGHGRKFWAELGRLVPDAKRRRAELRPYSLALF